MPNNKPKGRGQARRAKQRNIADAERAIDNYAVADAGGTKKGIRSGAQPAKTTAHLTPRAGTLRVIPLGGQNGIGEKNLTVIEYEQDAIVIDCGFDLSVDLPGINYMIPETTYLEAIKDKVRAYVITHGHLDHIGALPYVVPKVPAPIYGSQFTAGMVERQFGESDYVPETRVLDEDTHQKVKIGPFFVELIRVAHSIPGSTMINIETPVGRLIHTGDYRLDPEPLDNKPNDIERMEALGREGVALLMGESTGADKPGREATEHTLQSTFEQLFAQAPGRVFVATFSSNINRIQLIIDSAVKNGRKVVFDGRSLLSTTELAVRLGYIKIPKGTVVPMREAANLPDESLTIVLTGSQGEENAALQRMSIGDHQYIKLKAKDTVLLSSKPIPGNEVAYGALSDNLISLGVNLFRAATHEVDGCGPLHVSGHGKRDELRQTIEMFKPNYFMPVYAGSTHRKYHRDVAREAKFDPSKIVDLSNGEVLNITREKAWVEGRVPAGAVMVDQNGAIVPGVVLKDRLLLSEDGFVVVVLTIDGKSGQLLASPDIITRGFIFTRDNEELMGDLRTELKRFALNRPPKGELANYKGELSDHVNAFLFKRTSRSPVIIPVVNVVGAHQAQSQRPRPPQGQGGQGKGGRGRGQGGQGQGSRGKSGQGQGSRGKSGQGQGSRGRGQGGRDQGGRGKSGQGQGGRGRHPAQDPGRN